MARMTRIVAFIAAMSTSAAVVPATMESPVRDAAQAGSVPAATGTPRVMGVTPAEPPAKPSMLPAGAGALVIPGAILIGIAAAVSSGGGDNPAPFPAAPGTSGTL